MAEYKTPKISIGITSLTVVLCVLCLTVFAVLTLSTALSEKDFSEKRAQATIEFYAAETEAVHLVNEMKTRLEKGEDLVVFAKENGITVKENIFRFQKTIDDGQVLNVVLRLENGLHIEVWQVVSTADWTPDESLNVWDGLS